MISSPSYQEVLEAISKAKVRYLVAGGIAMNIHGMSRSTFDLDLIVFLESKNIFKFVKVMQKLGFKPKVPVAPEDFANEELRKRWIEEKNMVVFTFYHEKSLFNIIDVFVYHPRPFDQMFKAGKKVKLFKQNIHVVGLEDMLFLKERAGRPKDEMDIRYLHSLLRKQQED